MATIAILGNHSCDFSTESELDYTLEDMGHRVVKLQENVVRPEEILQAVREQGCRLFMWIRTHGWGQEFAMTYDQMLQQIKASGIRTCSFHLDRFWGLSTLDQREQRIGDHAFFKTDIFFSADGEDDERWVSRGIKHHWLLPGVSKRESYLGKSSPEFGNQVIFAGADFYHPEYSFRNRMVNQLKEIYGSNFRVYQGIRQERLNSLYATARVVVGDHCFAGVPRYVSDRLFETVGRGGFIIYPETEGVTGLIPGLVTYKPQDITDLRKKIDYYLNDANQKERIERRDAAHNWVKENGTYHNRMVELLSTMGIS